MKSRTQVRWWTRCIPDRSGTLRYVEIFRADWDPERKPRGTYHGGDREKSGTRWKRELRAHPSIWGPRILHLLSDRQPRTLNAISVELADLTADVTSGTGLGEALWALAECGALEFTPNAPVQFRRVIGPHFPPDYEAAAVRQSKLREEE